MIKQSIKIHAESYSHTASSGYGYNNLSEADRAVFEERHKVALEIAKKNLCIGDKIQQKSNKMVLTIMDFVEVPKDMVTYNNNPCVIYATMAPKPEDTKPVSWLRYSIHEFDMDTLVRESANEETENEAC